MTRTATQRLSAVRGFTLVELAIVVVVLGAMLAIGLKIAADRTDSTAHQDVNSQLDEIEEALYAFRETNARLPCPADQTLDMTSTNFGVEAGAAGAGTCLDGSTHLLQYPTVTPTHKAGAVPVRALGLPDTMAIDPWGRKLMYAVKLDATATSAFTTNAVTATWPGTLFTVNSESGSARTNRGLYVLLSFGSNGHGGYFAGAGSGRMNAGSVNTAEQANCACDATATAASPNLGLTFYQTPLTPDPANTLNSYDDVVRFKSRPQLASYAEANATGGGSSSGGWSAPVSGDIFIADVGNNRIRKVAAGTGIITTVAGTGTASDSGDGGAASSATLNNPSAIALDSSGNLYVSDHGSSGSDYAYGGCGIRKIAAATGIITTVAGTGTCGYSGDGGAATSAQIADAAGVALDSFGNLYITDVSNNVIRKVTAATGIITTAVGNGTMGCSGDRSPVSTPLHLIFGGIAVERVDSYGYIYFTDDECERVRRAYLGRGSYLSSLAGNSSQQDTGDGGLASIAGLNRPMSVAVDSSNNLYIGEMDGQRLRKVDAITQNISTVVGIGTAGFSGDGGAATSAQVGAGGISSVVVDSSGNIYIADYNNNRIRKVTAATGIITTVAGSGATGLGAGGYTGDGGSATSATLNNPYGVVVY